MFCVEAYRDKHLVQDVDEEELIENADCECKPKHTGDSVVQKGY